MCQQWIARHFIKEIAFLAPVLELLSSIILGLAHHKNSLSTTTPTTAPNHPLCSLLGKPKGHWSPSSLAHVAPQQFVPPGLPRSSLSIWPADKLWGSGLGAWEPLRFPRPWFLSNQHSSLWRSPSSTLLFSVRAGRTPLRPGTVLGFNPKKTKSEIPNPSQNSDLPVAAQVGLFWNVGKDRHILSSCCQYLCSTKFTALPRISVFFNKRSNIVATNHTNHHKKDLQLLLCDTP